MPCFFTIRPFSPSGKLTFPFFLIMMDTDGFLAIVHTEVLALKNTGKLNLLLTILSTVAAMVAVAVSIVLFFEKKKKDEEDLEHYLDCSIQ